MPGFGSNAVLGVSRQNSFGTVPTSWYKLPFASQDFNYTYGELTDDSIQGRADEPDRVTGIAGLSGNITANISPLVAGFFLRSGFGTTDTTTVVAGVYRHVFNPSTGPFDSNCSEPPIAFYVDQGKTGVNSAYQLYDCFVNNIEYSLNAGGYMRGVYAIVGKTAELVTKSTSVIDAGVAPRPFLWSATSIHIGGAANTRFSDIKLSFNNNLGTQDRIAGAKAHTYFFRDGFRQFGRMTATADLAMADWLNVKNETEARLVVHCVGATGISSGYNESLTIDIPRFVYTAHPIGVSGAGMVTVALEGRAMYSTPSGTICTVTLQNTMAGSLY